VPAFALAEETAFVEDTAGFVEETGGRGIRKASWIGRSLPYITPNFTLYLPRREIISVIEQETSDSSRALLASRFIPAHIILSICSFQLAEQKYSGV
jgi:hypothetical protein